MVLEEIRIELIPRTRVGKLLFMSSLETTVTEFYT